MAHSPIDLSADALCEQLDRLDDAVFAALDGCEESLELVERLWLQSLNAIDRTLLEETRAHYLNRARETAQVGGPSAAQSVISLLDAPHPSGH